MARSLITDALSKKITDMSARIEDNDTLWHNDALRNSVLRAAIPKVRAVPHRGAATRLVRTLALALTLILTLTLTLTSTDSQCCVLAGGSSSSGQCVLRLRWRAPCDVFLALKTWLSICH